ncbi:MAG TPA: hypothetical protein VJ623_06470 [Holophagaceae bacterium]|nr:hypothetical protein [Holophagaceae bacterium]
MQLIPTFRRFGFVLGGVLLAALAGCTKSHDYQPAPINAVIIKGKVTYDRIPLRHDPDGIPLGLETDPTKFELNLPARFVQVALYRKYRVLKDNSKDEDPVTNPASIFYGLEALTGNGDGSFSFTVVPDQEWMVEVQSTVTLNTATPQAINLLADPDGMSSTVPQQNRLRYCMRKAPDGSVPPTANDPDNVNHVITSKVAAGSGSTVVNFHIGINDSWFLADTEYARQEGKVITRMVPGYSDGLAIRDTSGHITNANGYQNAGKLESTPTGSRVLSILEAFVETATFGGSTLTSVTPGGPGTILDLHYLRGRSEPKGTYIEFDRSTYPQSQVIDPNTSLPTPTGVYASYDPNLNNYHFFGSVKGDNADDDAWDFGILSMLAARSNLYYQVTGGNFYRQDDGLGHFTPLPSGVPQPNLEAQMAMMEGFPAGMVAVIQKNPYIADTTALGVTYRDIRDFSGVGAGNLTPLCAPFYPALIWELALRAKSLHTPGNPDEWKEIVPATIVPFVSLVEPSDQTDTSNFYTQLKRMQITIPGLPDATSPFTDQVLQDLMASMGVPDGAIPWPRPVAGPFARFVTDWGTNPTSSPALPSTTSIQPFLLSMSQATPIAGRYNNTSAGELRFARFSITKTAMYNLEVELPNGPLTNGAVEVSFIGIGTVDGTVIQSRTFQQTTTTGIPVAFEALKGAAANFVVRVRMLSPTALQPDTPVNIKLVPVS